MPTPVTVALVTGGASGIGRAIVERLAHDGFHVVLADRNAELGAAEAAKLREAGVSVEFREIELTDERAIDELIASLPPLAALVNNAGIFSTAPFDATTADHYRKSFEVNLVALAMLTHAAARKMQPGAKIVNIASRAYLGSKNYAHYVASKGAVVSYTRAAAMELAGRGILVNAIAPGLIDTPLLRALTPAQMASQIALQPTGRAGQPSDVANAVSFLADPKMDFITGQVLLVDGGKSLGGIVA